jgi:hypothetical protein
MPLSGVLLPKAGIKAIRQRSRRSALILVDLMGIPEARDMPADKITGTLS